MIIGEMLIAFGVLRAAIAIPISVLGSLLLSGWAGLRARESGNPNNIGSIAENAFNAAAPEMLDRERLAGRLVGGVAHEFNNLLATVLGCLELMERRLDDKERLETLIRRASDGVDRATKLTSGLVHFARRQSQAPLPTDLNAFLRDITPLVATALGRRNRLTTAFGGNLDPVHADAAGLEAALLELCLVMREAIADGGQTTFVAHGHSDPLTAPRVPGVSLTLTCPTRQGRVTAKDLEPSRRAAEGAGAVVDIGERESLMEINLFLASARAQGNEDSRTGHAD